MVGGDGLSDGLPSTAPVTRGLAIPAARLATREALAARRCCWWLRGSDTRSGRARAAATVSPAPVTRSSGHLLSRIGGSGGGNKSSVCGRNGRDFG